MCIHIFEWDQLIRGGGIRRSPSDFARAPAFSTWRQPFQSVKLGESELGAFAVDDAQLLTSIDGRERRWYLHHQPTSPTTQIHNQHVKNDLMIPCVEKYLPLPAIIFVFINDDLLSLRPRSLLFCNFQCIPPTQNMNSKAYVLYSLPLSGLKSNHSFGIWRERPNLVLLLNLATLVRP